MTTHRRQDTDHILTDRLAKACVDRHNQADIGHRKVGKALETKKLPSKLSKHCHNQANIGLRKKDHAEVIKRCHNQASKGLERPSPTGASLACQEPPRVAPLLTGKARNKD
jgi:hypothetical protein